MATVQTLLKLPARGRPFALGTLYDANKGNIIPAISLCEFKDTKERSANVEVHEYDIQSSKVTKGDPLGSKIGSAGITDNLNVSVFANIQELKSSLRYYNYTKPSKTQARVTLDRSGITKDEFLLDNCLSKEKVARNQEWIEKTGATHVVVGITYGYEFSLVLETECESEEKKLEIEEIIKCKIDAWKLETEGAGSIDTKEDNIENKLTVSIHGNVQIPLNPISFKDAMYIHQRIPELVKDKDCPMTAHLRPLASICTFAPQVCSEITDAVLRSVTSIFDDINNFEATLTEIQTSNIATKEPRMRRKAKQLSDMLNKHNIWLHMKLNDIQSTPKMEKDASEPEQIQKVLTKHEDSPFSTKILGIYVSKLEKEVRFLEDLVKMIKFSREDDRSVDNTNREDGKAGGNKIHIYIDSDDTDILVPFDRFNVFVLEIPIIIEEDDLLKEMQNYDPDSEEKLACWKKKLQTLSFEDENNERLSKIRKYVELFVNLADSKKNDRTPAKFRCVFKAYEMKEQPTINEYNALTGESKLFDPDTYFDMMM